MLHQLPALSYEYNALEPYIDARTMEIHYTKHHQAYITNLNNALESLEDLKDMPIDALLKHFSVVPENLYWTVRNNGGGHYNHTLFWESLTPNSSKKPEGDLFLAIESTFSSFEDFQSKLEKAAVSQFGSGWAWLVLTPEKKLAVVSTANQDNPISDGHIPLLGVDVWEHAYYLHYQNRRADYLKAWWSVVNWDVVASRYHQAV
jgi:Fe-Mn family superoxide dismutase